MNPDTPNCTHCNSEHVVPIVFGMPGTEMQEALERGEIELGGCCVTGDDPEWHCKDCGHSWPKRTFTAFLGQWHITEMPMFSIEMFEPPMLWIHDERHGFLKFCGIEASVDYELSERDGKRFLEFTFWEPHRLPHCGRGWAVIEGDSMNGRIYFHQGDRSEFRAVRITSEAEIDVDSITHLLRQGPITVDPACLPKHREPIDRKAKKAKLERQPAEKSALKPQRLIPEPARSALKERLEKHIAENWDHTLVKLILRFRGAFAYVDVLDPTENFPTHLCRLGYLGDLEHWGFAFYKYSDDVYEKSRDWEGSFVTTPEKAFDVSATVYLLGG